jgi:hypothetical protein
MRYVERTGKVRHAYKILAGKIKGRIPLERHSGRWEDIIRLDLTGNTVGRCGLYLTSNT